MNERDAFIKGYTHTDDTLTIFRSIPEEVRHIIPLEIVDGLKGKGLTVCQAEVMLDIAKGLLVTTTKL